MGTAIPHTLGLPVPLSERKVTVGLRSIPSSTKSRLTDLYATSRKKRREARADTLLISFAKSGRTWLRVLIGHAISDHYGFSDNVLDLDLLAKRDPSIPNIVETHDGGTVRAHVGDVSHEKSRYADKRVLFMVRDPRDTVVSAYFQASKRKRIFDGQLDEYLRSPVGSIDTIIQFHNVWARERHKPRGFHLVRYEDLHEDPITQLRDVLNFLGLPEIQESSVKRAVEFASFENMRRLELSGQVGHGRMVLRPGDEKDVESYKTRRGKAGGYRDYLSEADIRYLDHRIAKELDPYFGY